MPADPEQLAIRACHAAGLDPGGLRQLRDHSNAVFVLDSAPVVVRVGRGADAAGRAARAIAATTWLHAAGYPCVEPLPGLPQPILLDEAPGSPVTFWTLVTTTTSTPSPTGTQLGGLLRHLHQLRPPFTPPPFRPLDRLADAVEHSTWLNPDDRRWLDRRLSDLREQLQHLPAPLGIGLVHGDAQLDNLIAAPHGPVVADWDNVAAAPYEWDLVPAAAEQRFGGPPNLLAEVLDAYGTDPTSEPGWPVLLDVYELRSIAAHIRRAPTSVPHAREATLRIASLRNGDHCIRWSSVG
jgi:Ser/Thr protein kinase RdoA (MazF antagonist)